MTTLPPFIEPDHRFRGAVIALVVGLVVGGFALIGWETWLGPCEDRLAVTPCLSRPASGAQIVTREVTPTACIQALDYASEASGYSADGMNLMPDLLTATADRDLTTMNDRTDQLNELTEKLKALAPRLEAASQECRGRVVN